MVQQHGVTQLYTAPTAIRTLMKFDAAPIAQFNLSSLRVLGSVGEPINPEAWLWYFQHPGRRQCSVVDTFWQTETGAHLGTTLPGVHRMKPGSCGRPTLGIQFAVMDPTSGQELLGDGVSGVLCIKAIFPSIARTVYGDHGTFYTDESDDDGY